MTTISIKSQYMKWIIMLATVDLIIILLFLIPRFSTGASFEELGNWKLLTTVIIPVVVILLVNVLPHTVKSALVYWKHLGWLPGTEAFSKYAPSDPRISMISLRNHVGELPIEPNEQNAKWYSLYKVIENEPEIADAQKNYLMYRDMAVLSLPFVILTPLILYFAGATKPALWFGAVLFTIQYILTALSARWSGIRFVTNVLAIHSSREILRRSLEQSV